MKKWQTWLISLSLFLLFIIPLSLKLIPNIRYIIKAPQSLQGNNRSGSIHIQLERRLFARVKAKVTFWGATTPKQEFEFTDYKAEIPFQLKEGAQAIIYHLRLTSNRGDYAFIGRIEAPKPVKEEGLQVITERKRYRPGDTVRALILDYSSKKGLMPDKSFEVTVLDNRQNIIDKQQYHTQDGLLIHEFSLAEKVNYGEWTLKVTDNNSSKECHFNVINFINKRVKLKIETTANFLSENEENVIGIRAMHFAGGDLTGNKITFTLKDGEELLLHSQKEIRTQPTKFYIPAKILKWKKSVTLNALYEDKAGNEKQTITLPVYASSSKLLAYPEKGFIVSGHPNKVILKLLGNTSESSLEVFYENKSIPLSKITENTYSLTVPNINSKIEVLISNNGLKSKQFISMQNWPTQPVRFRNIEVKNDHLKGLLEWDHTYHSDEIFILLNSDQNTVQKKSYIPTNNRSINFEIPHTNNERSTLHCQFVENGKTIRTLSYSLKKYYEENELKLTFENTHTQPGETEHLKATLKKPVKTTAALIVSDTSLFNSETGFKTLSNKIIPEKKMNNQLPQDILNQPQLLEQSIATNDGQSRTIDRIESRKLEKSLRYLFTSICISLIFGFVYAFFTKFFFNFLVLIAMLAILASLILPALSAARSSAGRLNILPIQNQAVIHVPKIRKDFKDNLLFQKVEFDQNGQMMTPVKIADNLTEWKAEILGFPEGAPALYATDSILSTKDLFIEFSLPVFFIKNDKTVAVLTIYDKKMAGGTLQISAPSKIKIGTHPVTLPSGKTRHHISLPIEFLDAGEFTLSAKVSNSINNDHIEKKLIVKSSGIKRKYYQNLTVSAGESIAIPQPIKENAVKQNYSLIIEPGMLSKTLSTIDQLIRIPTGCFEQTSSKNLPNIVIYEHLQTQNIKPELQRSTKEKLKKAYQRLLSYEVSGGGFSLHGKGPAKAWLSAYGLLQFSLMSKHIFVDPKVLKRCWTYLKPNIESLPDHQKVFTMWCAGIAEVLSEEEKKQFTLTALPLANSQNIWTAILACHILKQHNFNDEKLKKLSESVIHKIISKEGLYITPCNRRKKPALVTTAAFALELANVYELPTIASLKAILLRHQKGSQWYDTFSTAFAIKALSQLSDPQPKTLIVSSKEDTQHVQIDPNSTTPIKVPLKPGKRYSVFLEKGSFLPFKVENEVDFRYGSEESFQPAFQVKSNLGFKSKHQTAINLKINTSEDTPALNPMIEMPLTAGTTVNKWHMQKLERDNILRQYEIKNNRLIMYLKDFEKGEKLNFSVQLSNNLQGEFISLPGEYYEYYNKELLGTFKLPDLSF